MQDLPLTAPDGPLARRLRSALRGEVLFDSFSRGRYSTDASIYQIMPVGVVVPRDAEDVRIALEIAREFRVPLLPRGAGTSQCGQTVGAALVIDHTKHLDDILEFDPEGRRVVVQPGIVLDRLNKFLRPHGLQFPVDVSTASRATIGGMTGNNSCGSRSLRYGNMVHNVRAIDALLADGERIRFAPGEQGGSRRARALFDALGALYAREAAEIDARFPKVQRRVGGYNLDCLHPEGNPAHLLVGSEGTLAYFERIELALAPIPRNRVLGVCHFPRFRDAMSSTQYIVQLDPTAVELVDRTMIELAREIAAFRDTVAQFLKGEPDAVLLVEFAGDDRREQLARLARLGELMSDLGFHDAVVPITDDALQKEVWEVRKAGLNVMMSMKGDGKPVSFIEDCAVPLEHLADYTERLTQVFEKHGTRGTWYAHASVGCLHVRPILNMKSPDGARKMRAIAEEAFEMVRQYKGSHSGEHGDGLVRSEWHEPMYGKRIVQAFAEVKRLFDPDNLMNPGKIVDPPKMDDRSLFRYPPGYRVMPLKTAFDWSAWGGFGSAVEMCNNNGACRKSDPGVMCPSYRVTRDEQHLTRGRANTLRLALSGQLGPDAWNSRALYETMELCIGCKACKRECPTGVDMAKMKAEFLHHYRQSHPLKLRERLVAYLPRYAPMVSRFGARFDPSRIPGFAKLQERLLGFSARRPLPRWHARPFDPSRERYKEPARPRGEVVLFVDTFNTWFEPDNARAALRVLAAGGYRVHLLCTDDGRRLCCGRTFLANGLIDEARAEAERLLAHLLPYAARGVPIVGLEPSCLLTLRDEYPAMLSGESAALVARQAMLLQEFLVAQRREGRLELPLRPLPGGSEVLVHGHCHQKAFGLMGAVQECLAMIPGVQVQAIESGCCGQAGVFGYEAEHYDLSLRMAELALLPAVRAAKPEAYIVADGTSCRQQIEHGAQRKALHVAQLLALALEESSEEDPGPV